MLVSASICFVLYSSTSLFRSVFISFVWLCPRGAFLFPGLSYICIISWSLFVVTIAPFGRSVVCLFWEHLSSLASFGRTFSGMRTDVLGFELS